MLCVTGGGDVVYEQTVCIHFIAKKKTIPLILTRKNGSRFMTRGAQRALLKTPKHEFLGARFKGTRRGILLDLCDSLVAFVLAKLLNCCE